MLQGTHKSTFDHKGTDRHCYIVTGTPEELAEYKANRGVYYAEDKETGEPLFFTNFRSIMDTAPLVLAKNGKDYRFDERDLNNVISKANAIGGVVGQAISNQIASAVIPDSVKKLIAKSTGQQMDLFPADKQEEQDASGLGDY